MRRLLLAVGLLVLLAGRASADGIHFSVAFTPADLAGLSDALADVLSPPLAGGAAPLGVTGFDLLALSGGPRVDTDSSWWRHGVDGSTVGGVLAGQRVAARKGLPLRLDVGGQVGRVLGERFWGAELRWALLAGGVIEPAVGLRASHARLQDAPLRLSVSELELVVSKGFAIITPYAAAGYRRVEASGLLGDPAPHTERVERNRAIVAAGVRARLLPFELLVELRQGAHQTIFVAAGLGL